MVPLLAGITMWLVLPLNLGKIMGVLRVRFQWQEEVGVSNAQTNSGANIPWFSFILLSKRGDNFKIEH